MITSALTDGGVDLAILVALDEEFDQLFQLVGGAPQAIEDREHGGHDYLVELQLGTGPTYRCIMCLVGEMGPEDAGRVAERVLSKWKPATAVMLGIAGSLDHEIRLGDVVVATHVDAYGSNLKAVDGKDGNFRYVHRGSFQPVDHEYLEQIKGLPYAHKPDFRIWCDSCSSEMGTAIPEDCALRLKSAGHLGTEPKIHRVHLASGPVVGASTAYRDWLHERDASLRAIEMEAAGLAAAAHKRRIPIRTIILRGISDFGDERKSEVDAIGKGGVRRYAMRNATRLLLTLLKAGVLQSGALRPPNP